MSLRSSKKPPMNSLIKGSTTDLPGTSSNMNSNVAETKTVINKKKRVLKPRQASKTIKQTISQELSRNIDNVEEETQNFPKASVEENVDSIKQRTKTKPLQDIINITEKNLRTSTPKRENKITKKAAKKTESSTENKNPRSREGKREGLKRRNPKLKDSENESKKSVQREKRQRVLKKNTKDNQEKGK